MDANLTYQEVAVDLFAAVSEELPPGVQVSV
jgi:hypothetical protein